MTEPAPGTALALITGASGGIGAALAHEFAATGDPLLLVARSRDALEAVATDIVARHGVAVAVHAADLADPLAVTALAEAVAARGLTIRHLVNNAGFGLGGRFDRLATDEQLAMVDLNIRAVTALTRLFLPPMVAAGAGGILNVASTAAWQPGPHMAVYYASKAYVLSLSEALHGELAGTGVTVTALCPGPVPTGFQRRAGITESPLVRLVPALSAQAVARAGHAGYRRGRRVVIPGLSNRLGALAARVASHALTNRIVSRLNAGRGNPA